MKKTIMSCAILVILFIASITLAETIGDIDADGLVGLPEAIYALQATSGMKPQSLTTGNEVNLNDYLEASNINLKTYEYSQIATDQQTRIRQIVSETVNIYEEGEHVAWDYVDRGYRDLYSLTGYKGLDNATGAIRYEVIYNPHRTDQFKGIKKIGESWCEIYRMERVATDTNPNPYYSGQSRMYTIIGIEDVTTLAGTFEDCLKICRHRNLDGERHEMTVQWYAKGLGMIIQFYGNGAKYELKSYQIQE